MKNKFLLSLMSLAIVVAVASCDNGNADFSVVDVEPSITLGAMDGLVEGGTFTLSVTFSDGAEGSTTSTLASGTWNIVSGGAQVANGTLTPTGDNWDGTISATGLTAGDHTITVSATDTNGNTGTASTDFTVASAIPDITGTWTMEPVAGSLAVGPNPGSGEWWSISAGDVTTRACFYDDTYTFGSDGSFTIAVGADTWIEGWQGGGDACGAPVAPVNGGSFTYSFNGASLTVNGSASYLGLPKVTNAGELGNHIGATDFQASITYQVQSVTESNGELRMELRIETVAGVHWTFRLIRQ
ncbi:hypothetical protein [Roseivirga sp. E12]|uniref:hypothetical protein n=1 Tax=Roseivirga sp. E12 TaxID=2819237 RepID=UPI001ABD2F64|nr:hypothetical protein [Roseivirga sp. E12]MBO3697505.1 hypothetical protein [Roseivirga sp. E12]